MVDREENYYQIVGFKGLKVVQHFPKNKYTNQTTNNTNKVTCLLVTLIT